MYKNYLEEDKKAPQKYEDIGLHFLSPIPRHDLSNFNKLTTREDLNKYGHSHTNSKMQGLPVYTKIFGNLMKNPPRKNNPKDPPSMA